MNDQIRRLLKTYSNARKSWEAWCYLANFNVIPPNATIKKIVDSDDLLYHLRYLALKDFYIESAKILKKPKRRENNPDNLFDLLQDLKLDRNDKESMVEECLQRLELQRTEIDRICKLRDKFYAHLDHDHQDFLKEGFKPPSYLELFIAVEQALIALTSKAVLDEYLSTIPSRYDFKLAEYIDLGLKESAESRGA